jgi:hypothetical protein
VRKHHFQDEERLEEIIMFFASSQEFVGEKGTMKLD